MRRENDLRLLRGNGRRRRRMADEKSIYIVLAKSICVSGKKNKEARGLSERKRNRSWLIDEIVILLLLA